MIQANQGSENTSEIQGEGPLQCLVIKCEKCNGIIERAAGDVIFGDKWYHGSCWQSKSSSEP